MTRLGHPATQFVFYLVSLMLLAAILNHHSSSFNNLTFVNDYGHFFFIGIFAAIVANATGCGGGIIFLPAFLMLGMTTQEALATSFAIQCFGMTSGSLNWLSLVRRERAKGSQSWQDLCEVILVAMIYSISGLVFTQQFVPQPVIYISYFFGLFSILVGLSMLYFVTHQQSSKSARLCALKKYQWPLIAISAFLGGGITALLSIGVGEVLAIILLVLGYNVRFAVVVGVCVSAVTVLAAMPYIVLVNKMINLEVLLFAGPAALIGGYVARYLALKVSPQRLKIILSSWVTISGLVYLVNNAQ